MSETPTSCLQIIAKASKSLAKDKPLGVAELNLVQVSAVRYLPYICLSQHEGVS